MADVSAEVLANLMTALQSGENIMKFIRDNNLQGSTNPRELRQQFVANFGQDVFRNLMRSSMFLRASKRFKSMVAMISDVDQLDSMISNLQDVVVAAEAKKAEIISSNNS